MINNIDKKLNNPYFRYKYTKYELSKMVKNKFNNSNLTLEEFANKYNTSTKIINYIFEAKISFNIRIMKCISNILEIPIKELVKEEYDNIDSNLGKYSNDIKYTYDITNKIFNEIIIQHKINIK